MQSIVVVGASLAGLRAAETLRAEGFAGRLVVIGDEPHPPYDRPPLSKGLLTGNVLQSSLGLRQPPDLDAEWLLGERAVGLDARGRAVVLSGGRRVGYDGLVIATGATPRRPHTLPMDLPGVITLRTLDDAVRLRGELADGPRVAILGGGFIGTEVASSCRALGLDVTLVTAEPLLGRALGGLAEAACRRALDHGVRVIHPATLTAVHGPARVTEVVLDDDRRLPADVLVVAIGAAPATGWLEGSGARLADGVVCDASLHVTGLPGVVAAGDVARWPHPALGGRLLRLEHWTNAGEQAAFAARRLLHEDTGAPFAPVPSFWSEQFGTRIQGIGLPHLADRTRVVEGDAAGPRFVAEQLRDGEVVGVVTAGAPRAFLAYRSRLTALCSPALV